MICCEIEAETGEEENGCPFEDCWRPGGIAGCQVHKEKRMNGVEEVHLPSSDCCSQYIIRQDGYRSLTDELVAAGHIS